MSDFTRKIQNTNVIIKSIFMVLICYLGVMRNVKHFYIISFVLSSMTLNLMYYMLRDKRKIIIGILNIILTLAFSCNFLGETSFLAIVYFVECFIHIKSAIFIYFVGSCYLIYFEKGCRYLIYYILAFIVVYEIYKLQNYILNTFIDEKTRLCERNREMDCLMQESKLQNERQLQNMYMIKLEERERLSRELHDKIGHIISGSLLQLEAVKMIIENDSKKSKVMVANVVEVLRDGMEDIRHILQKCKPCDEEIGINSIKNILSQKLKNTKVIHNVDYKGNIEKINVAQWNVIYKAVMEGSTNTLKYSNADSIHVNIQVFNKVIRCEIKDNGCGCENIVPGMGLKGIQRAVNELQGKFLIDGNYGVVINIIFYMD